MSKNIGWSKKVATDIAKSLNSSLYRSKFLEAYPQKELHWRQSPVDKGTYQWIVILQKKSKKSNKSG